MGFWNLSDNSSAADTGNEYEVPGGNLEPIPEGSSVLAAVDEAKWAKTGGGEEYISLRWNVLQPETYKNRKIFHKLWVTDLDPNAKDEAKGIAKRDKAKHMLAAIDANAGGKLARVDAIPDDDDLQRCLVDKPMTVKLMVYSMPDRNGGDPITGNWVCAVAPKAAGVDVKPQGAKPKPRAADLEDVPF